jgi:benzoate/toluate 1,2-dioxygenase reductase subunit
MLEHLAARRANDQPVRLVYGVRDDSDLVEVERIEALRAHLTGANMARAGPR